MKNSTTSKILVAFIYKIRNKQTTKTHLSGDDGGVRVMVLSAMSLGSVLLLAVTLELETVLSVTLRIPRTNKQINNMHKKENTHTHTQNKVKEKAIIITTMIVQQLSTGCWTLLLLELLTVVAVGDLCSRLRSLRLIELHYSVVHSPPSHHRRPTDRQDSLICSPYCCCCSCPVAQQQQPPAAVVGGDDAATEICPSPLCFSTLPCPLKQNKSNFQ